MRQGWSGKMTVFCALLGGPRLTMAPAHRPLIAASCGPNMAVDQISLPQVWHHQYTRSMLPKGVTCKFAFGGANQGSQ